MKQVTQKTAASAEESAAAAAQELTSQAANLGRTSKQVRELLGVGA
jgi:methyl-accepting chemotaxis protein